MRRSHVLVIGMCLSACSSGSTTSASSSGDNSGGLTPQELAYQNQLAQEQSARDAAAQQAQAYTSAIKRVIAADSSADAADGGSAAVAARMAAIDITGAPGDFKSAYMDHIEAWRQLGRLDDAVTRLKSDDQMGPAVIGGILSTVFGGEASPFSDQLAAIKELEDRRPAFSEALHTTFAAVRSVAARYDVEVPES